MYVNTVGFGLPVDTPLPQPGILPGYKVVSRINVLTGLSSPNRISEPGIPPETYRVSEERNPISGRVISLEHLPLAQS